TRVTSAPRREKAKTLERATRECLTSPTTAIRRPASDPRFSLIVKQSSSAWVGGSCQPSPALMTATPSTHCATCQGTPAEPWRTTMASTPIALTVSTVSRTDSPLLTDDDDTEKFIVSADRRL